MTVHECATILSLPGRTPDIADSAYVLPGAFVSGSARIGERVGVFPGASVRADMDQIVIGDDSNLQDSVTCHVDEGSPLTVGRGVSVGHNAVIHGCTIGDGCLIGMHATVMNGAVIGDESLVAAGALVTEGTIVPPRSLVAGVPAKVRRELSDDDVAALRTNAEHYVELTATYRDLPE